GLEVIEAHWRFGLEAERIGVLIHPQSGVHSLVEYLVGSVIAQLSNPDMRVPIAHALAYPERIESGALPLELAAIGQLSFERPDAGRFPCLGLAYGALRAGGTGPAVLNAANEIAVEGFLNGKLRYTSIPQVIEQALERVPAAPADSLESVLEADRVARRAASDCVARLMGRAA
ncbi:MAG: 1-deoxy-D-xylulose-5-phosphate reductoisomerase, partial [Burkholderiales bacterium]